MKAIRNINLQLKKEKKNLHLNNFFFFLNQEMNRINLDYHKIIFN